MSAGHPEEGDAAVETVLFGLDGRQFAIDLRADDARALRAVLGPFVRAGRRVPARDRATGDARRRRARNRVVRTWARRNGYVVSDRGRIPDAVVAAYQEQEEQ